jgi:galactose-1-phosphate uridylyltransferase
VHTQGRIRVGEALLFPNLVPYAKWSSVSVYSPARHVLRLDELSPQFIGDNVSAQVEFGRAVRAHDPASRFVSINANHLPPSGSSMFHPHLQGVANPVPTTTHRVLAELSAERLRDYLNVEREAGERIVASLDDTTWLAAFAPSGLAELRALVPDAGSAVDLDRGRIAAVAAGISAVLRIYAQLGFQSFNLAMHEAADFVMVRVVARATFGPLHRSDTMWSEHLQSETVTDLSPERVAELARQAF